jgi:hypothetical protein
MVVSIVIIIIQDEQSVSTMVGARANSSFHDEMRDKKKQNKTYPRQAES